MKKIGDLICILVMLLGVWLHGALAFAELTVTSTVDRNEMGEGDTLTLTISVSSDSSVGVDEPQLPEMPGFDIINKWVGSESRSTFVNGKFQIERTQTFNYMLSPQKQGKLQIGSVQVNVDGKTYYTKPITVSVVAGSPTPPPSQAVPQGPFDDEEDLFSQFLRRRVQPGIRSQPVNPKDAFFIQVQVDKTEAYEGEDIVATWYLYTRGQISDIDTLKYPSLNGFWKEDIDVATRLDFTSEVVNGVVYRKALLASYALFPIKAGKALIDPYKARCTVITPSTFGFGRPYKYTKASEEVEIKVKPIPIEGRPKNFTGAVGTFKVSASVDSQKVPVNQPVTLKVRFNGRGNAKLIDLPKLNLPAGIELYDTKKDARFMKNGTSYKDFEVLLIPRDAGEVVIPPISVSIFDPNKKRFYEESTPEIKFVVVPSADAQFIPSTPLAENRGEPAPAGPVLPTLLLSWGEPTLNLSQVQTFTLWGVAYLLATFFLFWRARVEFGLGRKRRDMGSLLKSRFKIIHTQLNTGNWRAVGVETINTFYFLVGEISGQGGAHIEFEKLLLKAPPSVRRELGSDLLRLLKKFEELSFAPEAVVGSLKEKSNLKKLVAEMEALLTKAVKLGLGTQVEGE